MFFIGGEDGGVCNTDIILCDECYSVIHLFHSFEDMTRYFRWIDYWIFFFGRISRVHFVDILLFTGILDAVVANCVLNITVFNLMICVVINTIICRVCYHNKVRNLFLFFVFCRGGSCNVFEQFNVFVGVVGGVCRFCERFWIWDLVVEIFEWLLGEFFGRRYDCVCISGTLK